VTVESSPTAGCNVVADTNGEDSSVTLAGAPSSHHHGDAAPSARLDAVLNLKINQAMKSRVDAHARNAGISMGALVRTLIANHLISNTAPSQCRRAKKLKM
jgi:hypothetical protein